MRHLIFVVGVFGRDDNGLTKLIAQVDFEPNTEKEFQELPFDELAKRYLEPAIACLRSEVAA